MSVSGAQAISDKRRGAFGPSAVIGGPTPGAIYLTPGQGADFFVDAVAPSEKPDAPI